jgi:peptide/nickel transport system substrate-binding protein
VLARLRLDTGGGDNEQREGDHTEVETHGDPAPFQLPGAGARRALARGAIVALALTTAACARHSAQEDATRPIEVLVATPVETLDPRDCFDVVSMRASRLVHAGLSRVDPKTLAPVPLAARAWRWLGPTTLEVDLRDDLVFSSGRRFTSEDVAATWHALAAPEVGSRHRRLAEPIRAVLVDGPHRVRFELTHPHATLLTDLELPILAAPEAHARTRSWRDLAGLGPFRLEPGHGDRLTFLPRAHGVLPEPAHAIVVQPVRDENARVLRLASGRGDVAFGGISTRLFPALEASGVHAHEAPGSGLTYLLPRVDAGPLADVSLRRALASAVDRSALVHDFLEDHAEPARELFGEGHWAHARTPPAPETGTATIRAPRVALRLLVSTDRSRRMLARFLQQDLAAKGFDITLVPLELGTLFARLSAGDFDLALLNVPELLEPNVLRVFLHSASIPPSGSNRGRVRDPELDRLLDLAASVPDRTARAPLYAEAEARIVTNGYWIPLWHEHVTTLTSPRAAALEVGTDGRWLGLASLP